MALVATAFLAKPASAKTVRNIVFPVIGPTSFINDWKYPRVGHLHQGNDVFGYKGQPLVAVADGYVNFVPYPQPSYGYMVSITDDDGYEYWYLHINNDNPGTDDGRGGGMHAYAPGIERGARVKAGQLIGWMGDSGNAEPTRSHVHFELHEPDGDAINPFYTLSAARRIGQPVPGIPQAGEIFPLGNFKGSASIAVGNVDPNSAGYELVVAPGPGGGPNVRVYSAAGKFLFGFFAYAQGFRGGLDIATADVDANGVDEIVTAAGRGGGGEIRIFTGRGKVSRIFYPYNRFTGEIYLAGANVSGDERDEIIVSPGRGGGPEVRILNGQGKLLRRFFAYAKTFRGGIDVAAIDQSDERSGYVVTAPLAGGGPHVRVFGPDGRSVSQFFPYRKEFRAGLRISAAIDPDSFEPVIMTVPGGSDDADIRVHAVSGALVNRYSAFEKWWRGGYDVATANDGSLYVTVTSPSRRATVRNVLYDRTDNPDGDPTDIYGD